MPNDSTPVLGVDGARRGWVGVRRCGPELAVLFATTLPELVGQAGDVRVVAIDMPLHLEEREGRAADRAAQSLLGPRRASLFPAPLLGALDFADADYAGANAWSKATGGRGLSKQAWFLVPKIREVRAFDVEHPGLLHEAMPELAFRELHGAPLTHAKTTWTGLMLRLRLLRQVGIELPDDCGPAGSAAPDDVVDAAALAWSAERIAAGRARRVPEEGDGPVIWW